MRVPILICALLYTVQCNGFSILERIGDSSIYKEVIPSREKDFRPSHNTKRDATLSRYQVIDVSSTSGHDFRPPTATDKLVDPSNQPIRNR
jgi:hypothetical protein